DFHVTGVQTCALPIFLAGDEEEWVVKIVDFGVAKAVGAGPLPLMPSPPNATGTSSEVTHTGMVLGSPQYMSPEQARGFKEVDHTDRKSVVKGKRGQLG